MMLEEAAGISGLHVRRKDAEQKLRAASNNLDRLDTVLADMLARSGQLKRQARQAERYRRLTTEIGQAEARLIYVRWKEAKEAADAAKAEAAQASGAVEAASSTQAELTEKQQSATTKLAGDRAAAMAARDASSDLNGKIIKLTSDIAGIVERIDDLETQAQRIASDGEREGRLTHDAAESLESLKAESKRLAADIAAGEEERPALLRASANSEKNLRESELALARAHTEQAKADAEQRVAKAALAQAETRLGRLNGEADRLAKEKSGLGDADALTKAMTDAQGEQAGLEAQIKTAEAALENIEAKRGALLSARNEAQNFLAEARADHAALKSEQDALERALATNDGDKAIDQISAAKGYEHALAAALGDDADAAIGAIGSRRWGGIDAADMAAKGGRLSDHVKAPPELMPRLAMIHVASADDRRKLLPGERLVTLAGRMRRWDGFVAENDGATHAEALVRANRLNEIEAQIDPAAQLVRSAETKLSEASSAIDALSGKQNAAEENRQLADNALRQTLREVDRASDALTRLQAASEKPEQTDGTIARRYGRCSNRI